MYKVKLCSYPIRTPTPTQQAVATMAPTSTPFIEPSQTPTPKPPSLGPVPQDCPPGPTPRPIFAGIGPGIGSFPVWAFGFDGPHAVLRISPNDTYTQYGWIWKIVWEVGPNYMHPVTLHSGKLSGGAPLWFQFEATTRSPVLDPQHPNHPLSVVGSDWAEWGSYLFIPTAGCYFLEAGWPGGHWRITFAAGRQ